MQFTDVQIQVLLQDAARHAQRTLASRVPRTSAGSAGSGAASRGDVAPDGPICRAEVCAWLSDAPTLADVSVAPGSPCGRECPLAGAPTQPIGRMVRCQSYRAEKFAIMPSQGGGMHFMVGVA